MSARASCLHRHAEVYPEPHLFRPQIWLNANGSVKTVRDAPEIHHWWWAFSSGGRVCLGNHFATHDVKIVAGFIFSFFQTELVSNGDMKQSDEYIGGPRGGNLMIRVRRVD